MSSPQLRLLMDEKIIVDLFAGGGGMSVAMEMAWGRSPDIAINHNADALSMHRMNHPQTRHFVADVFEVCPRGATQGRPVGWLHLSPDCTHHSQARGGQPRSAKIRSLAWVGVRWAGQVLPDVISLENVKQFLKWGPLIAKRDQATGRVVKLDGSVAAPGERIPVENQFLVPDPRREGQTYRLFVRLLEGLGYTVDKRLIVAANHGGHTTRERLFMIASRTGQPILWEAPTHFKKPGRGQRRWRPAADCIDWSIGSASIFDRQRPLADATLRRIARGIVRYVLESGDPFIVNMAHGGKLEPVGEPISTIATEKGGCRALVAPLVVPLTHHGADRGRSITDPLPTITAAHRGEQALLAPILVQTGYGEREGQAPRALDVDQPLGTIVGTGKHAVAAAYLMQANGGFNTTLGHDVRQPVSTVTNSGSQQQLVTAFLSHMRGNCDARDAEEPLRTVSAAGLHHGIVECILSPEDEAGALRTAAFLMRYYGEGGQWSDLRDPMTTVTTKDRMALVTVTIKGTPYVIVDIGLRMLDPRELFRAQDFPDNYIIDRGHDGRRFSKSAQVRMVGNSVDPLMAVGFLRLNAPELAVRRIAA
jgi:DNA (cytosine-5)-methyltransferase 1